MNPHAPTVLLPEATEPSAVKLQSVLIAGFMAAGYRPLVLFFGPNAARAELYRAIGDVEILRFDVLDKGGTHALAERLLSRCVTLEDVLGLEYEGIAVGRYALSTLFRRFRLSKIDIRERTHLDALTRYLATALAHVRVAHSLVESYRVESALFQDKGYIPEGPLYSACSLRDISPVTWNAAHRDDALIVKRYHRGDDLVHPVSLSEKTRSLVEHMPWEGSHRKELLEELTSCYASGSWYSEVGTQFRTHLQSREEVRERLELSDDRPVVAIFPHIFWDATFFWGTDLFRDYEEWFVESVAGAIANPRAQWLIKVHPGNLVKNARDSVEGEPSEMVALRDLGPMPPHVKVIPATTDISSLALLEAIDVCVTVRGTIGLEAAVLGKTVITAGTGRYDRLGFTVDPATRDDYLQRIATIHELERPTPSQTERAQRHAYGIFILRPLQLTSLEMGFTRDETATLTTSFRVESWDELRESADVSSLARWLRSGDRDYLDPKRIPAGFAAER